MENFTKLIFSSHRTALKKKYLNYYKYIFADLEDRSELKQNFMNTCFSTCKNKPRTKKK